MRNLLAAGMVLLLLGAVALAATGTVKTGPHMLDGWVITDDYGRVMP